MHVNFDQERRNVHISDCSLALFIMICFLAKGED